MIVTGTTEPTVAPFIPQTGGWVGIVDGTLILVRTYADDTLTACTRDGDGWGLEVELDAEVIA